MQAIIKTGGKQYLVTENQTLKIEKLKDAKKGDIVSFDQVLLTFDDKTLKIGTPVVEKALVTALVIDAKKDRKITVYKYKSKTRYRRKQGHRQEFVRMKIQDITC